MLREKINELLMSTGREGMINLLGYMKNQGFYTAPCSTHYHLCKEGGLAEHSLNVRNTMESLSHAVGSNFPLGKDGISFSMSFISNESLNIVSLLHDLGKMGEYGKANYVPNMIKSKKKDEGMIVSTSKPFITNPELLNVPHEIRSIQIASKFIELTEEESFAILYHNALYGDLKYQINGKERPLQMLLHFADLWCSRVIEVNK